MPISKSNKLATTSAKALLQWKTHYSWSLLQSQCHYQNCCWIANRAVKLSKARPQKSEVVEMIVFWEIKEMYDQCEAQSVSLDLISQARWLMVLWGPIRPDWVTKKLQALVGDSCTSPYKPSTEASITAGGDGKPIKPCHLTRQQPTIQINKSPSVTTNNANKTPQFLSICLWNLQHSCILM